MNYSGCPVKRESNGGDAALPGCADQVRWCVRARVRLQREERNAGDSQISSERPPQVIPFRSVCAPAFVDVTVTSRGRVFLNVDRKQLVLDS